MLQRSAKVDQLLTDEAPIVAKAAGLHYVSDSTPGVRRQRCGKGFIYFAPSGLRIQDRETLRRLKRLVIPPAWEQVWIAPFANAHIQAIGRDDRARKQYIYHPDWFCIRDEVKFSRMTAFSKVLPKVRSRTEKDLRRRGLPKAKVLAAVVRLLDSTYVRIGNPEYANQNESFGLTTLRDRHVDVAGENIHFEFRGKRGVEQKVDVRDRRLAHIVRQCQEIPGYALFQYYDEDNHRQPIDSGDVNEYLQAICGEGFTAKDFRTWGGTLLAILALFEIGKAATKAQAKKNIVQAVKQVAEHLGNQPSACRKYYIHPEVLNCYMEGTLIGTAKKYVQRLRRNQVSQKPAGLELEERVMLKMLESCA